MTWFMAAAIVIFILGGCLTVLFHLAIAFGSGFCAGAKKEIETWRKDDD
jgi:hypothetical protein